MARSIRAPRSRARVLSGVSHPRRAFALSRAVHFRQLGRGASGVSGLAMSACYAARHPRGISIPRPARVTARATFPWLFLVSPFFTLAEP